ncbi:MAG: DUF350 domain-containing protein [Candidatus Magasanikbacteria bacterium]|jgi:putative membrane protein|nr:DUF350 domain-containing protein [Candidatus Magasanikbacteria bacterium]
MKKTLFGAAALIAAMPLEAHAANGQLNAEFGIGLVSTLLYAFLGILMLFIAFKAIDMMTPGHLAKQLAHENNLSIAIVTGAALVGVSIVVAAAIAG